MFQDISFSSSEYTTVGGVVVAGAAVYYLLEKYRKARNGLPFPPGPPKTFLLGNLLNFPKRGMFDAFTKYQKEYGALFPKHL